MNDQGQQTSSEQLIEPRHCIPGKANQFSLLRIYVQDRPKRILREILQVLRFHFLTSVGTHGIKRVLKKDHSDSGGKLATRVNKDMAKPAFIPHSAQVNHMRFIWIPPAKHFANAASAQTSSNMEEKWQGNPEKQVDSSAFANQSFVLIGIHMTTLWHLHDTSSPHYDFLFRENDFVPVRKKQLLD